MVQFDISSVVIDTTSYDGRRCEVSGNTQDLISKIDGIVVECLYKSRGDSIYRAYVHYDSKWWVVINHVARHTIGVTSIHTIGELKETIRNNRMSLIDKIEILSEEPTVFTPVLPGIDNILLFIRHEELLARL